MLVTFFAALHEDGHIDLSPSRMHGGSLDKFWAGCFRDEEEREMVVDYVSKRGRFRARGSKVGKRKSEEAHGSLFLGADSENAVEGEGTDAGMRRWEAWYATHRRHDEEGCSMPPLAGDSSG